MRILAIANPDNRRLHLFQAALQRLAWPPARVVSYADLLGGNWSPFDELKDRQVVRIESPGEHAGVERALVHRGAAQCLAGNCNLVLNSPSEHGRIDRPDLWFAGYRDLLTEIERRCGHRQVRWMNTPAEIPDMFDKTICHERLKLAGLPVPAALSAVDSYQQLRRRMRELSISRVFVKLRSSSSASGVVALRVGAHRVSATTPVELVRRGGSLRLYNSLRLRRYTNERDVADLVDALCGYGVHVERWVPKAAWQGETFDLRVVVIGGQVRHTVMRCSRSPLTNLHLGNRRGNVEQFLSAADPMALGDALESCRRVCEVFPHSLYFGVDLMFTPDWRRHFLLEVNAFGDLLPGVLCGDDDTYAAELKALLQPRNGQPLMAAR